MKRTTPMYGHTQQIQIAIAKDPLYRKNQQTMCIQDPTHIFSFLLLTNYLVEAKCMPGDTHPVLSQKPSQDLRIVACLDESPSRFVHVVLGWWVRRLAPFLRCLVETSTKKKRLTAKAINQLQQWVHLSHLQASIGQLICTVLHCLPKGLRWPKGVTVSDS